MKNIGLTSEEKDILRKLMETPGIEKEWNFFESMSDNMPPPEYFMRGKPEPKHRWALYAFVGMTLVGMIGWTVYLSRRL